MDNIDTFSIFFHHGGTFLKVENNLQYGGGQISGKHGLDRDRFGFWDLEEEVKSLGYNAWDSIRFFDPKTNEFKNIRDDKEVVELLGLVGRQNKYITVFVDNGKGKNPGCSVGNVSGAGVCLDQGLGSDSSGDPVLKDALGSSFESSEDDTGGTPLIDEDEDSETDDGLSDTELAEDDEEYLEARRNKSKARKDKAEKVMHKKEEVAETHTEDIGHGNIVGPEQNLENISDYEDSDGEINSMSSGSELSLDEKTGRRKKIVKITYDPKCDHKSLRFKLAMRFNDAKQCKEAIVRHALENGHPIHFTRSNKRQVEAKCIPECNWKIYASLMKSDNSFMIKTLGEDHSCPREMNNKLATCEFLGNEYLETFRERPETKTFDIQKDMMKRFATEVSYWRAYRAQLTLEKVL